MGVQYQGAIAARSDARFSITSGNTRAPDLTLQPCSEGVDFTLRLVQANRMAKVVELRCAFDEEEKKASKKEELSEQDVTHLFQAIGGNEYDDDDDENNLEEVDISEEYQAANVTIYGGLPHLESLSIVGRESTPSFIVPLTSFLSASGSFPRFTRISLQGVNLRGGTLELRALAEAFRLHPNIQNVNMAGCWFTPEQQANMDYLEHVFKRPGEPGVRSSSVNSQRASIKHMKQLVLQHQSELSISESTESNNRQPKMKMEEVDDSTHEEKGGFFKRLLKSCFCFW